MCEPVVMPSLARISADWGDVLPGLRIKAIVFAVLHQRIDRLKKPKSRLE
jgi:hypothetical protein